jgi:hypothetical protein
VSADLGTPDTLLWLRAEADSRREPVPSEAGAIARFRVDLPGGTGATIECLDVAGRVLGARELGTLPAGVHDVAPPWSQPPAAGVYWIRVRQGAEASATRVVIVR